MLRYQDLLREVSKFANVLKRLGCAARRRRRGLHAAGSRAGDRTACLRPDRRAAHGDLRRLQRRESLAGGSRTARRRCWSRPTAGIAGASWCRSRRTPTRAAAACPTLKHVVVLPADRHARRLVARPRPLVARARGQRVAPSARPSRSTASIRCIILYTSGSTGKPKGILHTTGGYLLGTTLSTQVGLRPQGRRHLLVHGRRRLGDRPLVPGLRPAVATAPRA